MDNKYGIEANAWVGENFDPEDERPNKIYDLSAWPIYDIHDLVDEKHDEEPGIYIKFMTHDPVHYFYELKISKDNLIRMLNAIVNLRND